MFLCQCCARLCSQRGAQGLPLPDDFTKSPELFPLWEAGISGQGQVRTGGLCLVVNAN